MKHTGIICASGHRFDNAIPHLAAENTNRCSRRFSRLYLFSGGNIGSTERQKVKGSILLILEYSQYLYFGYCPNFKLYLKLFRFSKLRVLPVIAVVCVDTAATTRHISIVSTAHLASARKYFAEILARLAVRPALDAPSMVRVRSILGAYAQIYSGAEKRVFATRQYHHL